jgi:hypothetical protein
MRSSNQVSIDTTEVTNPAMGVSANRHGGPGLKNLAAFHELMRRDGFCVPALNSKFVNQVTLTQMYTGKIYNLRQENIVYRECVKPPSKLVMVQKLEKYLAAKNIPSGITMALTNFPDK